MSSSKISAGEAYVTISCDSSVLKRGLQEASKNVSDAVRQISADAPNLSPKISIEGLDRLKKGLAEARDEFRSTADAGKSLTDLLTITAGDVYNAVKSSLIKLSSLLGGIGDQYDKMALRTCLSTEALSEYAHASSMCGADITNVEGALKSLSLALVNAQNGSTRAQKAFTRLGLDFNALARSSPERQFDEVARAISSIVDPTERAGLAMKIFRTDFPKFHQGW